MALLVRVNTTEVVAIICLSFVLIACVFVINNRGSSPTQTGFGDFVMPNGGFYVDRSKFVYIRGADDVVTEQVTKTVEALTEVFKTSDTVESFTFENEVRSDTSTSSQVLVWLLIIIFCIWVLR